VYHVELVAMLSDELKRISLHKLERIMRLRLNVHTDNLKAGAVIAHRTAAGFAECIQQEGMSPIHPTPS